MPIKIVHDGSRFPDPPERCCFCRTPCRTWHAGKDVAVCEQCAPVRKVKEIPTKAEWIAKERALTPPRPGEVRL